MLGYLCSTYYTGSMDKKLAVFDIDGTLFRWQLYHELVYRLKDKGCFPPHVAAQLDEAFIGWNTRRTSFSDYEAKMLGLFTAHLSRIPPDLFDATAKEVVNTSGHKVYQYTHHLLRDLRSKGYFLLAVSGSQQEIVDHFASLYGFDAWIGTLYERDEHGFTGSVTRIVPGHKARLINAYVKKHHMHLTESVAIGDSGTDIELLQRVDHPIAFNPSADLLAVAQHEKWKIVIERKNIAYILESTPAGKHALTETIIY